jgi:hypothetical protein
VAFLRTQGREFFITIETREDLRALVDFPNIVETLSVVVFVLHLETTPKVGVEPCSRK